MNESDIEYESDCYPSEEDDNSPRRWASVTPRRCVYGNSLAPLLQSQDILQAVLTCLEDDAVKAFSSTLVDDVERLEPLSPAQAQPAPY